eukprot:10498237-Karenia_brevis.AAC.1
MVKMIMMMLMMMMSDNEVADDDADNDDAKVADVTEAGCLAARGQGSLQSTVTQSLVPVPGPGPWSLVPVHGPGPGP